MSEIEELANRVREKRGDLNPEIVNHRDKSDVEQLADRVRTRRMQKKVVKNEPISASETSWGNTISNAAENFSIYKFVSAPVKALVQVPAALWSAIENYKVTGKALKDFGVSTLRTGIGRSMGYSDEQISKHLQDTGDIPTWLNLEKEISNTYGTEAGLKKHLENHPEDALSELLMLFIPGGKVAELLGAGISGVSKTGAALKMVSKSKLTKAIGQDLENLSKLGTTLEKTGKVVSKIGTMGDPLNLVQQSIKQPISFALQLKALRNMPQNIYTRAIKLSDKIPEKKREQLLKVALDNDAKIVYRDVNRIEKQITDLNEVITNAIKQVDQSKSIDLSRLKKGLGELKKKKYAESLDADSISAIDEVSNTIDEFNKKLGRWKLNPVESQKLKVGLNKELGALYKRIEQGMLNTPASAEAKMVVNRNLRKFLEVIVPETEILKFDKINKKLLKRYFPNADKLNLKDINMIEGNLIEIKHAMEMEVNKLKKGSFFDFKVGQKTATFAFAGGAGARALTSDPATISAVMAATGGAGFVIGVLDSSSFLKSKLGVYLRNLQRLGLNTKSSGALIRMGLYNYDNLQEPKNEKMVQVKDN